MRQIETCILNPEAVLESEKMMICAARLTQRGHTIKSMADFLTLYERSYTNETKQRMINLPHPTLQKFGVINAAVVGASRRFLAQITRHQNEVKYMSASLQYSDYSGEADFTIPYEFLDNPELSKRYLNNCKMAMEAYIDYVNAGCSNDSAGYIAPQGLRNILIISATPFQWKHMIGQRTCRRNTAETRYVMLRIWEQLFILNPVLFSPDTTGMACIKGKCMEGSMGCGTAVAKGFTPTQIIESDFPLLTAFQPVGEDNKN